MITINYRVNIFGSKAPTIPYLDMSTYTDALFIDPKSRALNETSLSLLDVRAAVEWAYENIEAFGGNKDNIMVSIRLFNYMRHLSHFLLALGTIARGYLNTSLHTCLARRTSRSEIRRDIAGSVCLIESLHRW